eukprot:COSAG02_NODE_7553_length_2963_cov_4.504888_1_plen_654_part_00
MEAKAVTSAPTVALGNVSTGPIPDECPAEWQHRVDNLVARFQKEKTREEVIEALLEADGHGGQAASILLGRLVQRGSVGQWSRRLERQRRTALQWEEGKQGRDTEKPRREEHRKALTPNFGRLTPTSHTSRSASPTAVLEQDIGNYEQLARDSPPSGLSEQRHSVAWGASQTSSLELDLHRFYRQRRTAGRKETQTLAADLATQRRLSVARIGAAVDAARREERERFAADLTAQRKKTAEEVTAAVEETRTALLSRCHALSQREDKALADLAIQREQAATQLTAAVDAAKRVAEEQAAVELNAAVDAAKCAAEEAVHAFYKKEAATAAAAAAAAAAARNRTCCICQETFEENSGVSCASKHFTCSECMVGCIKVRFANNFLGRLRLHSVVRHRKITVHVCTQMWTERDPSTGAYIYEEKLRSNNGALVCPFENLEVLQDARCEAPAFTDAQISRQCSDEEFQLYLDAKAWTVEVRLHEKLQAKLHATLTIWKAAQSAKDALQAQQRLEEEQLAEALKQQFPGGRMCKQCKHGPVDHMACANLNSHHGERVGNATISNACMNCGWRAGDIGEWPAWDGVLRVGEAAVQACSDEPQQAHTAPPHAFATQMSQLREAFPGVFPEGYDDPLIAALAVTDPPGDLAQARALIAQAQAT